MKRKRTYSSQPLSKLEFTPSLLEVLKLGCLISIDVAKEKFVFGLATLAGEVLQLFRFEHPRDTKAFLARMEELKKALGTAVRVVAAMEPTGTYGDVVRYQLTKLGVPVHSISPKATHDSQEIFDGVPSMHDGKSVVHIAKLFAVLGPPLFREKTDDQRELRALVDQRKLESDRGASMTGVLEAMLARHWPELGTHVDVNDTKTPLALLARYTGPAAVAADTSGARELLLRYSRRQLDVETIERVVESARSTLGVPLLRCEEELLRVVAEQLLLHRERTTALDQIIELRLQHNPELAPLRRTIGPYTTAVVVAYADPRSYASARAFEKGCGLNVKIHSSGTKKGRVAITKRGPSIVRQVLYLATIRLIQANPIARAWYVARQGWRANQKQKALTALMRKLARALWYVARGSDFDAAKLFDTRRLKVEPFPEAEETPRRAHGWFARASSTTATRTANFVPPPQP